jgi:tRNA A-37 threonylcarbamoyl transferase component Bud32
VAYRVHAEAAEQAGNWLEAARQWERAGELDRALGIYKKLNEFGELARLYEARGELAEAAALRMRASDFEEAGRLYQAADKPKEAAHAFWRSGDLARAVSLLEGLGDWLTMAKVFLSYEKHEEARKVLRQLTPSHAGYRPGLQLLASLEERERRPEDAYRVYEKLVRYAVETKTVDANTRTWIIAMARILFRKDKREEGLATYKKLHPLGLMTAEDAEYVTRLEAVQERKRHSTGQFRALSQVLGAPSNERYEFRTMIAQGGNGVIWLAHDNTLDREMVIKMIRQTALPSDIAIQWFLREAKTAAKLNHPNIVTIYDLGEMQGQPYIAMEYVAGETLVDLVERTELPMQPKSLVTICEPLCSALNYAHDKGFVHRDIKLENVMITSTGEVKLMDFGLAQAMHGPDDDDMVTGTPLYMAPEQIVGGEVDHRADIYALGVMVYLLAAGQWPFERGNILHHHRFTPVPDPREFNPDLPEAFSDVIMKCLAKNRDERYGKVTEVAEDLRRSLLG